MIFENVGNIFIIHTKRAVEVGNMNNVNAILIVNICGKGLTGKAYICLWTNSKSKYVPIKQETMIVATIAFRLFLPCFFSEQDIFFDQDGKLNFFKRFAVFVINPSICTFSLID